MIREPGADLVFRGARLAEQEGLVDIAVSGSRIAAIGPHYPGAAAMERAAEGMLATTPFIDAHHHLDCAYLSHPPNVSGTLEEAIRINAEVKPRRSPLEVRRNACRALEQALLHGTGWIRSHVDIDSVSGLRLLAPVLEAKEEFRGRVDVQIVAFPQLGLVRDSESIGLIRAALREGAQVVGGMPHGEASRQDAARHIDLALEIAQEYDVDVDMHIDETDDPASRTLELLAEATIREGYQGRVTAGHCCALAAYPDDLARRVIDRVAEAGIHVVTNPMTNLYLQGRHDRQPVRRGITRVRELLAAGVNVACGLDDVGNIFFPFGRMDMLEVAMITAVAAHLTTPEEIETAFDMPRHRAARALRLTGYGLRAGAAADFLLLDAGSAAEALQRQPARRLVVRGGRIVAETVTEARLPAPIG